MTDEVYLHSLPAVPLEEIIKEEYRNYQIYTLMDRAIPYLADGLKPSQRRILYTLWRNQSRGLIKVSSLTGLVLTLHPHGPASVESSVVNLAQDYSFTNNYPLIDKKGYFGERMETTPAAARYIECKLGKVAELILFDDMNQVAMVPNYDEKVMEPVHLLPKLPIMLLNGSEGIGTGFSSVIPSFNHKDIINSMIQFIETGKPKRMKPWYRYYDNSLISIESQKITFNPKLEQKGDDFFITELPRGYDAQKIYRFLNKLVDNDYIKDYIDSSVDNHINIELVFKRGKQTTFEELQQKISIKSSLTPNYTLISERGVKILDNAEEIIALFTQQRINVVQRRYDLLIEDYTERLKKNNEIIRFIKEKHYAEAEKKQNRKAFVEYLEKEKFKYAEYLADMAIYRMTKEEVEKRQLLIKEETKLLAEYKKIAASPAMIRQKLIEELKEVDEKLDAIMKTKENEKAEVFAKSQGAKTKKKK
ncbi:MAG: hypothetical protein JNM93_06270 [Bacteriovoracaceae bacterium]|nr:hypothetical protein [Bacteriovoracaceae bacterium]